MTDFLRENPLVWLIGACEVGFWVLLGAGLAARYLMRARRLSTMLLLAVLAHRYAGGPSPVKPPEHGRARIGYEWREWGKAAAAWVITFVVLLATAAVAGAAVPPVSEWSGDPLWSWSARLGVVVLIWFVGWPLWVTLFPPRPRERADA